MSLQVRLAELITAIGADIHALYAQDGTLTSLTTTDKSSLVAALNEIKAAVDSLSAGAAGIDDGTTSSGSTWSSQKVSDAIQDAIDALVAGAPSALDTLNEIAEKLGDDDTAISALLDSVANRLRFDAAQTLTAPQKVQGNANLGSLSLVQSGDPETDLVALYTAAKA